ncbi:NADH-quinone oxidoreductase subunit N [Ornithinimicrobium panacihumi]|uniref:NADH-quinone oxidoreductase subunit N n=1 Tax=Ornithinimicrobium panacihumi TaxID=2008449 RepID=UPI003F895EF3
MKLTLELVALLPVLAPLIAAVLVLVVDAALPRQRLVHLVITAAGLAVGAAAALPGLGLGAGDARSSFCGEAGECWYSADRLASALQIGALGGALVVLVLAWREWSATSPTDRTPVVVSLLLGATAGTAALPTAGDLGTLLVSLELATIPTVALVALTDHRWSAGRRAGAVDGAIALLATSLVSFALLAMGVALWVAATGSAMLSGALGGSEVAHPGLLALAAVFALAGLAFKLSAVPFHAWTPLTYATAPLPVTAFLATVSKIAPLGALVVIVRALGTVEGTTFVAVAALAALSMTVGNVVALVQQDSVRLLAWSTVAQAGWVLLPLASVSSRAARAAGSYLLVYVVATLLAFVVVVVVATSRAAGASHPPATSLEEHRGLLRTRPLLAMPLALALLTLAGLPPGIAGLVAKVVALRPVVGDETWWLAIIAVVNVALGIAVYLRWLVLMLAPAPASTAAVTGTDAGDGEAAGLSATRVPLHWWVLVAVLSALLVLGSVAPIGVI